MFLHRFVDAVEIGHFVEHADHAAFGAGPVVADDVKNQSVVELTGFFEAVEQAADFVVAVFAKAGVDFHLAGKEFFLVGGQLVPVLDRLWFGSQLRTGRNHAERDLPRQRLFAHLVPAAVKLTFVLGDPFLRHMMRRVRGAGREVHEEWFVRRQRLLKLHPGDRVVGHVGHEVVAGIVRRLDPVQAFVEAWRPLVGLAADEAVELVEA